MCKRPSPKAWIYYFNSWSS